MNPASRCVPIALEIIDDMLAHIAKVPYVAGRKLIDLCEVDRPEQSKTRSPVAVFYKLVGGNGKEVAFGMPCRRIYLDAAFNRIMQVWFTV